MFALNLLGAYPQLHISYIVHVTVVDVVLAEIDRYNPPSMNRTQLHIYAIGSRTAALPAVLVEQQKDELKTVLDEFAEGTYHCNCGLKLPYPKFVICDVSIFEESVTLYLETECLSFVARGTLYGCASR